MSAPADTSSSSSSSVPPRKDSLLAEDEPDVDASAQDAANVEVTDLIAHVRSTIAEDDSVDPDEARDEVKMSDHLDMSGLTLSDKNEEAPHSQSNSVQASPAIGASNDTTSAAAASSLATLPPVELKDGGNASIDSSSSSSSLSNAKQGFYDVRVAIVGNVDSGKSTLIGTLTSGQLDDGRGKARSKVFIHAHELGTGRTSAISQHIMGFDAEGKPVHQTVAASAQSAAKSKSWASVISASRSIVTFTDLAGHEKYLKTTIAGLTGCHPDYACVIVNSLAGVTKMTKEHLGVVLALEIPLICVVTKVDLVPTTVLESSKKQLFRILKSSAANKLPIQMRNEKDVEMVISNSETSNKICPVFFISAVNGTHINLLTLYLSKLKPHLEWLQHYANAITKNPDGTMTSHPNACEFSIDEVFNVSGVGIVVSGTLASGTLSANSTLLLGPHSDGSFIQVLVRSLHYKRVACASVEAGQSCAVSIRAVKRKETLKRNLIRRGMVLVDPVVVPEATRIFDAEVLILHHPTTIKLGYQAVLHCGMIRQTAQIVRIVSTAQCLRTGDKSTCRFRFLQRPEYLHPGASFVFREGSTKGIGKITRVSFTEAERKELEEEDKNKNKKQGKSQQKKEDDTEETGEEPAAAAPSSPSSSAASSSSSSSVAASAAALAGSSVLVDNAPAKSKWTHKEKTQHHQEQEALKKSKKDEAASSSSSTASKEKDTHKDEKGGKDNHKDKSKHK